MRIIPGKVCGGHRESIHPVSFSPDGDRFVAGDQGGGLIVRSREGDLLAKTVVEAAGPHSRPQVKSVAWSPDGSRIGVHEHGAVRLRGADDLVEESHQKNLGTGRLAFAGGGRWLAALSASSVAVRGVPELDDRGLHLLARGGYEYFTCGSLTADPDGPIIAVGDDGGCDETAMGMKLASGEPQVTLIDAGGKAIVGAVERGHPIHELVFDRWRRRLLVLTFGGEVGVWSPDGAAVTRFTPYPGNYVRSLAVCERWIATVPNAAPVGSPTLDFWNPSTYERLDTVPLQRRAGPSWIVASPDGGTLVMPEYPVNRDLPVGIYAVE
jgi:WD40 repeat protein